ncbi:MAG TPA: sialidase family protein [Gaiellaceae bacterium]|nr:sialidase family protein [Gaiellaceae bacterium]
MRRHLFAALFVATLVLAASASGSTGFTTQVSPSSQTNATEPYIAIDRSDGTVWVAWQASGSHVARSDDGGRSFTKVFDENDIGDVDIAVGGPVNCTADLAHVPPIPCTPGTHRVYLTSLERTPLILQTHLAYSDDRGANWTVNDVAAVNPQLIDRPWLAVDPSRVSATSDDVYVAYHDFTDSQIYVATSHNGGDIFGPSVPASAGVNASISPPTILPPLVPPLFDSFCNTVPSGIEVDPETHQVYVQWLTADPVANTTEGCNVTMIQNFHKVWIARSDDRGTTWTGYPVYNGAMTENASDIFAALAVDDSGTAGVSGNVYSVFADNKLAPDHFDIWFTHSSNQGATWSPLVKVNSDKGTHFFPWIAAGTTGRVDFIWLNSPDYTPTDAEESPWYVTFAQTTNATSATPKFQQTSASSNVMHVGGICVNGIFCTLNGGNRDLADSISIAIDRGGSAGLAWTDQGRILHGPRHITYGCNTSQQSAIAGANQGLSCKGPAK